MPKQLFIPVLAPILALGLVPITSGCVAGAALDVATAPVRAVRTAAGVAGRAVDAATTSQSESDENRGREIRRREERLGQLDRQYQRHLRQCDDGDDTACLKARDDYSEIQYLLPRVPYENS